MTDPTNLPRLYGEKEIDQILQRAAELQHDEPPARLAGGMALQEACVITTIFEDDAADGLVENMDFP